MSNVALALLLAIVAASAARAVGGDALPAEDAAMLLRYAEHLAQGDGIVWNRGEAPLDGATDLLFLFAVAGLNVAGLPLAIAARLVSAIAHVALVALVYFAVRRLHHSGALVAWLAAACVACGPGLAFIAAGFGAPLFALCACVAWCFATQCAGHSSRAASLGFACSALVLGLARPEGLFLGVFMLCALLWLKGLRAQRFTLLVSVLLLVVLGGSYFAWRWQYFGYPLPNPFYKKGGGQLYPRNLIAGVLLVWQLAGLQLITCLVALCFQPLRRVVMFTMIPVIGFLSLWILISDETNFHGRFQYAVLPILLVSWPAWLRWLCEHFALRAPLSQRRVALAMASLFPLASSLYAFRPFDMNIDGLASVATVLREYRDHGYQLATTEAGLLPLYSGWRSIDTWGLNDAWIAHHGVISLAYLDEKRPELLMIHAFSSPVHDEEAPERLPGWTAMVRVLKHYARTRNYELVAVYGRSPFDTHWYYVRRDFPDSAELTARIRALAYDFRGPSLDFARLKAE